MENIIQELEKIEELAKHVTYEIEEDKKNLPNRIEQKRLEILNEIQTDMKERIAAFKKKSDDEAQEKIMSVGTETQNRYSVLKQEYARIHESLANEIFHQIIGR